MELTKFTFRCRKFLVTPEEDGWVTIEASDADTDMAQMEPVLYSLQDIANITQSPLRTVREWTYKNKNPLPMRKLGKKVFVLKKDFDRWLGYGSCPSSRRARGKQST